jgi:hypothetical protein
VYGRVPHRDNPSAFPGVLSTRRGYPLELAYYCPQYLDPFEVRLVTQRTAGPRRGGWGGGSPLKSTALLLLRYPETWAMLQRSDGSDTSAFSAM